MQFKFYLFYHSSHGCQDKIQIFFNDIVGTIMNFPEQKILIMKEEVKKALEKDVMYIARGNSQWNKQYT